MKKVLIGYFSGTGATEKMAEYICFTCGASKDVFGKI